MENTLPILTKSYALYKSIVENNNYAEKRWRYSLCATLEKTIVEMIGQLVMAKAAPKQLKAGYLIRASAHQELCSMQLRMCMELEAVNQTKLYQSHAALTEVGRMLGGWLRSC